MALEQNKRPKRTPLSNEEVANVIAFKKRRDLIRRIKLKNSLPYKIQNIYNVACFFIYCELIICFLFPGNYDQHFSKNIKVQYGSVYNNEGDPIVSKINITDTNDREYDLIVDDYMELPKTQVNFFIAKDYLLQKELKGRIDSNSTDYGLFTASPVLLLSVFILIISLIIYMNNLNENAHSLMALSVLNILTLIGILCL